MTEQLSLWSLIANASFIVQFVMLLLFLASVVSWVMIIQRGLYLREAEQNLRQFEDDFWSGVDLNQLYEDIRSSDGGEGLPSVFRSGFREFSKLSQQAGVDADAVMEGTERSMRVALSREEEKLNQNLPFLASVASVSPYIGLFGTVWGIMNSFRGLANVHQATLAVVAPGISEALIATAMGLFAAIPAVLAYNRYSATADTIYNGYETFAEEFSTILHRRIHSK
jgi:biopolymer transport protein TolQ|tara:strand:+ start:85 stop:759 length:675 start_codon:yes stop_codon:yes gene_type:complete